MKKKTLLYGLAITIPLLAGNKVRAQVPAETVRLIAPLSGLMVQEYASNSITASNQISSGVVEYRAGQSVTLVAGFEVKPGSVFSGEIESRELPSGQREGDKKLSMYVYPNPTLESATLEYFIPTPSKVSIVVTNVQGIVMDKPVDNIEQSEGRYSIPLNTSHLSSGVYLCVLTTSDGQRTYKVTKQN